MKNEQQEEKMLTIKEASGLKGVPVPTLKALCRAGKFPRAQLISTPVGQYWLIPAGDLDAVEFKKRGRPKINKNES